METQKFNKCKNCKRRKFTEEDRTYIKYTGRCKICDDKVSREIESEIRANRNTKSPCDLSQHSHIY